ncbi:MAG: hypothetical protein HY748_10805 [Elusimicrobia bacterium]|nr:hypothetical protein [Elusimicrobiota bacterium]
MRFYSSLFIVVASLSVPAWCAEGEGLNSQDAEFLGRCGVAQADIGIFKDLPEAGQAKLRAAVARRSCGDNDIVRFKNTRRFVKLYMTEPPPSQRPAWDRKKYPWIVQYMTGIENDAIVDLENLFINQEHGG